MVRTQIQLTKDQSRALKSLAAQRGVPVAELIRQSVDRFLQRWFYAVATTLGPRVDAIREVTR